MRKVLIALVTVLTSAVIGWLFLVIGQNATAAVNTSSPVTSVPGPYYNQGDIVNVCVNILTEAVRVEVHTNVLGNCAANEIQLSLEAMPSAPATYTPPPPVGLP